MTIDVINHLVLMLIKITLVVCPLLVLIERSRNTSAANLHGFVVTLLVAVPVIPVAYFMLPNARIYILESEWLINLPSGLSLSGGVDKFILVLCLVYCLGVAFKLLSGLVQWLDLKRMVQNSMRSNHRDTLRWVAQCANNLNLSRKITVIVSDVQNMPVTWGVFNPIICLPSQYLTWGANKIQRVLMHEVAHIKRKDAAVNWLVLWIDAVMWCVPGIHWIIKKIEWYREVACDDLVLGHGVDKTDYAQDLLEFSKLKPNANNRINCHAVGLIDVSTDYSRIHTVLDGARVTQSKASINIWFALVVVFIFVGVGVLQLAPIVKNPTVYRFVLPAPYNNAPTKSQPVEEESVSPGDFISLNDLPMPIWKAPDVKIEVQPEVTQPLNVALDKHASTILDVVAAPELVHYVPPQYPKRALKKGKEAEVLATFDVLPSGQVANIRISGKAPKAFNQAVKAAVGQFVYQPNLELGQPTIKREIKEIFKFQIVEGAN